MATVSSSFAQQRALGRLILASTRQACIGLHGIRAARDLFLLLHHGDS